MRLLNRYDFADTLEHVRRRHADLSLAAASLYTFQLRYMAEYDYMPSLALTARELSYSSVQNMAPVLQELYDAGLVVKVGYRRYRIVGGQWVSPLEQSA